MIDGRIFGPFKRIVVQPCQVFLCSINIHLRPLLYFSLDIEARKQHDVKQQASYQNFPTCSPVAAVGLHTFYNYCVDDRICISV